MNALTLALSIGSELGRTHEYPDPSGRFRLLRSRHEGPCERRPTKKGDEMAALHVWMAPAWQETF